MYGAVTRGRCTLRLIVLRKDFLDWNEENQILWEPIKREEQSRADSNQVSSQKTNQGEAASGWRVQFCGMNSTSPQSCWDLCSRCPTKWTTLLSYVLLGRAIKRVTQPEAPVWKGKLCSVSHTAVQCSVGLVLRMPATRLWLITCGRTVQRKPRGWRGCWGSVGSETSWSGSAWLSASGSTSS